MRQEIAMPALTLSHVDKFYGPVGYGVHAVQDVSLDIRPGELVALLGSSGCGKTSTLRMVAGFEEVSRGEIVLKGRAIHRLPPARRNVAMAFEGYSLYPPLTIRENIAFALKSARLGRAESKRRVAEVARLLEITDILDRYPSSVSGGQQQRASLGRALVREADLYLLDEPMGQLEPQLRAVLRGRLKHHLRERGMTSILVTHDQTEANALADRIAVMEGGVLQQFATPRDLKDAPANLFVGTFIGEPPMNVFPATASETDGRLSFVLDRDPGIAFSYPSAEIASQVRQAALRAGKVVVGIRPHAVRLGSSGLSGTIVSNQWLGDQTHVAAELGRAGTIVSVVHERLRKAAGETVSLSVAARDIHLFDPATGRAISHGAVLA